jgi:hypothetical protein
MEKCSLTKKKKKRPAQTASASPITREVGHNWIPYGQPVPAGGQKCQNTMCLPWAKPWMVASALACLQGRHLQEAHGSIYSGESLLATFTHRQRPVPHKAYIWFISVQLDNPYFGVTARNKPHMLAQYVAGQNILWNILEFYGIFRNACNLYGFLTHVSPTVP